MRCGVEKWPVGAPHAPLDTKCLDECRNVRIEVAIRKGARRHAERARQLHYRVRLAPEAAGRPGIPVARGRGGRRVHRSARSRAHAALLERLQRSVHMAPTAYTSTNHSRAFMRARKVAASGRESASGPCERDGDGRRPSPARLSVRILCRRPRRDNRDPCTAARSAPWHRAWRSYHPRSSSAARAGHA